MEISVAGVTNNLGLPKMTDSETALLDLAVNELYYKQKMVEEWYAKYCRCNGRLDAAQYQFFLPRSYNRFDDCAYATL